MPAETLPVGKLPPDLLASLLDSTRDGGVDVVVGPGIGFDCAVVALGDRYLVLKSDPITFVTEDLGWYLVQVNVNDLATTGARPRWMLITLLFPEKGTDEAFVREVYQQIQDACRHLGIAVVGGHTEITHGLSRPLALGTLVGDVAPEALITPAGMRPGDRILLTKGVPIEATAILAREFAADLRSALSPETVDRAAQYLFEPGISVLRDAQTAAAAGRVTAMHDPTEGGVIAALWEMAEAGGKRLVVEQEAIPVPAVAAQICQYFEIDPLVAIASGALLLTVEKDDVQTILAALEEQGIGAAQIGVVEEGPVSVWHGRGEGRRLMPRPERDAIARLFEQRER